MTPAFFPKAAAWRPIALAALFCCYFASVVQIALMLKSYSGFVGLRSTLLYSLLWLIPLLMTQRIKLAGALIGLLLWASSLAGLGYFLIYGQEFSQSVLFVMLESNPGEMGEYAGQYLSVSFVLYLLLYTLVGVWLWSRLQPVTLPLRWRALLIAGLAYGLLLHPFVKTHWDNPANLARTQKQLLGKMEPAAPWQLVIGYAQYRQQLAHMSQLLEKNSALPPLQALKDNSGDAPRTLVLVIGESTQRGHMGLYGYPRDTTPRLTAMARQDPNLTVFNDVVTPRPYTIETLEQVLTFANEKHPDRYLTQPTLMNLMKQAGYKTFWITNQMTLTARNTLLTVFSRQTDRQFYMNQQRSQNTRQYDESVLGPFAEVLADPAPRKFIVVHLLGTHIRYENRYPQPFEQFEKSAPLLSTLGQQEQQTFDQYDNANLYNDFVVSSLFDTYRHSGKQGFMLYLSDHGEEVYDTPPHQRQGRDELAPTRNMYTVPFLLWTSPQWANAHPRDLAATVNRKYSSAEFIHTWSDLAGLSYQGWQPQLSLVNPQFVEQPRWIGNPDHPHQLRTFDSLPNG